ncbi:unnamed protein product [Fusarium venenatum]|uniref:Uncharacterized protein n=1 Tax=Fusarium venenatum TaxID=56646 RepID=A0A2L2U4H5_9HYPO|nr:uncharacterized protein FVRRES_10082 [Fusarium venenatum]CEI70005.1 unnamed protein product [Fusarium venenatum]
MRFSLGLEQLAVAASGCVIVKGPIPVTGIASQRVSSISRTVIWLGGQRFELFPVAPCHFEPSPLIHTPSAQSESVSVTFNFDWAQAVRGTSAQSLPTGIFVAARDWAFSHHVPVAAGEARAWSQPDQRPTGHSVIVYEEALVTERPPV